MDKSLRESKLGFGKKMFTGFPKDKVQNSRVFLYFPKTLKELVMYKL